MSFLIGLWNRRKGGGTTAVLLAAVLMFAGTTNAMAGTTVVFNRDGSQFGDGGDVLDLDDILGGGLNLTSVLGGKDALVTGLLDGLLGDTTTTIIPDLGNIGSFLTVGDILTDLNGSGAVTDALTPLLGGIVDNLLGSLVGGNANLSLGLLGAGGGGGLGGGGGGGLLAGGGGYGGGSGGLSGGGGGGLNVGDGTILGGKGGALLGGDKGGIGGGGSGLIDLIGNANGGDGSGTPGGGGLNAGTGSNGDPTNGIGGGWGGGTYDVDGSRLTIGKDKDGNDLPAGSGGFGGSGFGGGGGSNLNLDLDAILSGVLGDVKGLLGTADGKLTTGYLTDNGLLSGLGDVLGGLGGDLAGGVLDILIGGIVDGLVVNTVGGLLDSVLTLTDTQLVDKIAGPLLSSLLGNLGLGVLSPDTTLGVAGGGAGGITQGGQGFGLLENGGAGAGLGITAEHLGINQLAANGTTGEQDYSDAASGYDVASGDNLIIFGGSGGGGGIVTSNLLGGDGDMNGYGKDVDTITVEGTLHLLGGAGGGGGLILDAHGGSGFGATAKDVAIDGGTVNVYGGAGGGANITLLALGDLTATGGGDGTGATLTGGSMSSGEINIFAGKNGGDINDDLLGVQGLGLDLTLIPDSDTDGLGGQGTGGRVNDFTLTGGTMNIYGGTNIDARHDVPVYGYGTATKVANDENRATANDITNNGGIVNLAGGQLTGAYIQTDGELQLAGGDYNIGADNGGTAVAVSVGSTSADGKYGADGRAIVITPDGNGGIFSGGKITALAKRDDAGVIIDEPDRVKEEVLAGAVITNTDGDGVVYASGQDGYTLKLNVVDIRANGNLIAGDGSEITLKGSALTQGTLTMQGGTLTDTNYTQSGANTTLNLAGAGLGTTGAVYINGGFINSIDGDSSLAKGSGVFEIGGGNGTVTADGNAAGQMFDTVTNDNVLSGGGTSLGISGATVVAGGTLKVLESVTLANITNNGTISMTGTTTAATGNTLNNITNAGTIDVAANTTISGNFTQSAGGAFLNLKNAGTITTTDAVISITGGKLTATGTNNLSASGTGSLTLGNLTVTLAGASDNLALGGANVAGAFVAGGAGNLGQITLDDITLSSGSITLGQNSTLTGEYAQTTGQLILDGGAVRNDATAGDSFILSGGSVLSKDAEAKLVGVTVDGSVAFSVDTAADTLDLVNVHIDGGGSPIALDINKGVTLEDTTINAGTTIKLTNTGNGTRVGSLLGDFIMNNGALELAGGDATTADLIEIHGGTVTSTVAGSVLSKIDGGELVMDGVVNLVASGPGTLDLAGMTIRNGETVDTVLNTTGKVTLSDIDFTGGEIHLGSGGVLDGAFEMTDGLLNIIGGTAATLGADLVMNLVNGALTGTADFGAKVINVSGSGADGMVTVGGSGSAITANYAVSDSGRLTLLDGATMTGITMDGEDSEITLDGGILTGTYTQYEGTLILGDNWMNGDLDFDHLFGYDGSKDFVFFGGGLDNRSSEWLDLTFDEVRRLFNIAGGFTLSGNINQHGVLHPGDTISVGDGGTVTLDDGTDGGNIDNSGGLITSDGDDGKASDIVIDLVTTHPSEEQGKIVAGDDGDTITTGILDMTDGGNLLSGAGSIVKEAIVGENGILTAGALGTDGKYVDGAISIIEKAIVDGGAFLAGAGVDVGLADITDGLFVSGAFEDSDGDGVLDRFVNDPDAIAAITEVLTDNSDFFARAGSDIGTAEITGGENAVVGAFDMDGKYVSSAASVIDSLTSTAKNLLLGAGSVITGTAAVGGTTALIGGFEEDGAYVNNATSVIDTLTSTADTLLAGAGSDIRTAVIGGTTANIGGFDTNGEYIAGKTSVIDSLTSTAKALIAGAGSVINTAAITGGIGLVGSFDGNAEYVAGETSEIGDLSVKGSEQFILGAGSRITDAAADGSLLVFGAVDGAGELIDGAVDASGNIVGSFVSTADTVDAKNGSAVIVDVGSRIGDLLLDGSQAAAYAGGFIGNATLTGSSMQVQSGFMFSGTVTMDSSSSVSIAGNNGVTYMGGLAGDGGRVQFTAPELLIVRESSGSHTLDFGSAELYDGMNVLLDLDTDGDLGTFDITGFSGSGESGAYIVQHSLKTIEGELGAILEEIGVDLDNLNGYLSGLDSVTPTSMEVALKAALAGVAPSAQAAALAGAAPFANLSPTQQATLFRILSARGGMSSTAETIGNAPAVMLSQTNIGMFELSRHFRALREANQSWKNDNCLDPTTVDIWASTYTHHISVETMGKASSNMWGLDIGFDKQFDGLANGSLYLGAVMGGQWLSNFSQEHGGSIGMRSRDSEGSGKAFSLGVYGAWMNDDGWYANAAIRHFWSDLDMQSYTVNGSGLSYSPSRNAFALSAEIGRKIDLSEVLYVEPSVGLTGTWMGGDSFSTSRGDSVRYGSTKSLEAMAGVALGYNGLRFMPYIEASVIQALNGRTNVDFAGARYSSDPSGTRFRGSLGASYYMTSNVSLSLDVAYEKGSDFSDINGNFAINFSW